MGRTPGWTTTARETRMAKNRTTLLVYFVLLATRSFRCWHVVYDLRTKSKVPARKAAALAHGEYEAKRPRTSPSSPWRATRSEARLPRRVVHPSGVGAALVPPGSLAAGALKSRAGLLKAWDPP